MRYFRFASSSSFVRRVLPSDLSHESRTSWRSIQRRTPSSACTKNRCIPDSRGTTQPDQRTENVLGRIVESGDPWPHAKLISGSTRFNLSFSRFLVLKYLPLRPTPSSAAVGLKEPRPNKAAKKNASRTADASRIITTAPQTARRARQRQSTTRKSYGPFQIRSLLIQALERHAGFFQGGFSKMSTMHKLYRPRISEKFYAILRGLSKAL